MHVEHPPDGCDICVIGAGIVGLAAARALKLRHPGSELVVLEREVGPARHQTGHSSGIIHAGIYYSPGTLKARLCVEGAAALYEYCQQRDIPTQRRGKVVVATGTEELPRLDELERRGQANGVPGLQRLDSDRLREIEPHATGVAALHSPATGVVDFVRVARELAGDVEASGGKVHYGCQVQKLDADRGETLIRHSSGSMRATRTVVCAGGWADRLAIQAGANPEPRIVPFRGAYLRLRPDRAFLVRGSIYPVPDPDLPFLGVHLSRTANGDVLLGPTALLVGARDAYRLRTLRARDLRDSLTWPGTWRLLRKHWPAGLRELRHAVSIRSLVGECRRYVPELDLEDVERTHHSGVRAQAVARDGSLVDDFVVDVTDRTVHVRNAPSPAATAALALAEEIADRVDALSP